MRAMLRIRMVEQAIATRYGEQKMRCPVHLSIGQEAVAVGVAAALQPDDRVLSSHRCHAHYLACGGDLRAMIAELHGSPDGCNGGRGGSMHLQGGQLVASLPIVGSAIPVACGMALADKLDGNGRATVVFFGDAAVEEGVFHEAANLAAVKRLPVLFVCEDNGLSIHTPLPARQPDRPFAAIAMAHGLSVTEIGGQDVVTVARCAAAELSAVRASGPAMLVCRTTRMAEHCGPKESPPSWRSPGADPLAGYEPPAGMVAGIAAEIDEAFAA